jgi:hypothetical protein
MFRFARLLAFLALLAGCAPSGGPKPDAEVDEPKAGPDPAARAEGKKFLLAREPGGARGVIAVRKEARDGDEVIVAGQVGGSTRPFTAGRASFLIVDASLKPSFECSCPWDFCEYPKQELAAARLAVKFVAADGKTLGHGARAMFGVKELSTVVVKGRAQRDDNDNVVVLASGIFVRPEAK